MAVVYSIASFPRTAEDVINELNRKEQKEKRPVPCHKRMRAEMSREVEGKEISGKETGFEWVAQEVAQRNPEGKKARSMSDGWRTGLVEKSGNLLAQRHRNLGHISCHGISVAGGLLFL